MLTKPFKLISIVILLTASALCLSVDTRTSSSSAHSAPAENIEKPQRNNKPGRSAYLSLKVHSQLQQVQQALIKENNAAKALELMATLEDQYSSYKPYERAIYWHVYATIYNHERDYPNAQLAYERLLEQPDLPDALVTEALYRLAQLHFIQEQYPQAINRLNDWFEFVDKPAAAAFVLLGQSHYQLKDYPQAGIALEKAVAIARERGEQVKENWYLLLRAIYYQQQDYEKTLDILMALISEYPKKEYYAHVASIYAHQNREFEHYSMLVGMADAQLLDKGDEQLNYAQLLIRNNRPYRAARLIEEGLAQGVIKEEYKSLKLLSTAWILAKEFGKSIPVLEQAAKLSDSGDDYVQLAHAYINTEAWGKAEWAVTNALDKGNLNRPDAARIMLGMSLYHLDKYEQALTQFSKVQQDNRSREIASQWQQYVRAERQRKAALDNL